MAGTVSRVIFTLVVALYTAMACGMLFATEAMMKGAGVPIHDASVMPPYALIGIYHGLRMFSVASLGLCGMLWYYGPRPTTFLVLIGVFALLTYEEHRCLVEMQPMDVIPEAHIAAVRQGRIGNVVITLLSLVGWFFCQGQDHKKSQ